MLVVDGSQGEGGGQVLRTSLGLSLVTGVAVRFEKIRAGRSRPGLRPQHLAAVEAAAEVGAARVEGARVGARELTFAPGRVRPGAYAFSVDTAGSMTLVLQTVLPALLTADEPSTLSLRGGTHNPLAPPWDYLEQVVFPLIGRMGAQVSGRLERPGFYPAGGGKFEVRVEPARRLTRVDLLERGEVVGRHARALVSRLPRHVGERELAVVAGELGWADHELEVVEVPRPRGPGNALLLTVRCEQVAEVFTAFGEKGRPAEAVGEDAARQVRRYLEAGAPVGEHLADQLILLLALARAGSFRTAAPLSGHAATQVELIPRFLPVDFAVHEVGAGLLEVEVVAR